MPNSLQKINILESIHIIRGQKVMLDFDLAKMYGVETKVLNQSVRRNQERFPEDFMFQLAEQEMESLRSQIVTSKKEGKGGVRYLPYAFTEQGVAMLSSVLRSKRAIEVNISIMRTFVQFRKYLLEHQDLEQKLIELESDIKQKFFAQDKQISDIFKLITHMLKENEDQNQKKIGFDVSTKM